VDRHDLDAGYLGFQPGDHELQGCLVIGRPALAPRAHVQRLAIPALDDEVRIASHAVDLAAAEEWQRFRCIDTVGAELQAGRSGVRHNDRVGHGESLRRLAQHAVRIARQRVRVKQRGSDRHAARRGSIRPALVKTIGTPAPTTTPAVSASARNARLL
jgi:hypothetical protein